MGDISAIINREYHSLASVDYKEAVAFWKKYPKCHEIPVIESGRLLGIVTDGIGKPPEEWESIKKNLIQKIKLKKNLKWYCKKIRETVGAWCDTNMLVYDCLKDEVVFEKLSEEERNLLKTRRNLSTKEIYNDVVRFQWSGKDFFDDFEKISFYSKNGVFFPNDLVSKNINIANQHRVVTNKPTNAPRRVYMFGPCIVFGAFVIDEKTIEYYLQEYLNSTHPGEYEVVNCGYLGPEICMDRIFVTNFHVHDLLVLISPGYDWIFKEYFPNSCRGDLSIVYEDIPNPTEHFLDNVRHCDWVVNKAIAKYMCKDVESFLKNKVKLEERSYFGQKFFVSPDVYDYFEDYFKKYFPKIKQKGLVGAVVMNCNPYTKGHRFLVEYASKKVDSLIIFVVEENRSEFSFSDRINMVRKGVEDLKNVTVVPSGNFIISKNTFSQYFEKDVVTEVEDMDFDIHIFCTIVASRLKIKVRFAGEEPNDRVTARYNKRMNEMLPEYGLQFEVIQRATMAGETISASVVRRALKEGRWDIVEKICPSSTVEYLKTLLYE